MTWPPSISCLSSVVENEENLFERFDKNAPQFKPSVNNRRLGIRVVEIGKAESAPSVIVRNPTVSRFAFRVSRFAFRVSRFAFHVSRFTFHVSRFTFHVSRFAFRVSRFAFRVSRFAFRFLFTKLPVPVISPKQNYH
jgi:hypothetical protein